LSRREPLNENRPSDFRPPRVGIEWEAEPRSSSSADRLRYNFAEQTRRAENAYPIRGVFCGFNVGGQRYDDDPALVLQPQSPTFRRGKGAARNERRPSNSNVQAEVLGF
jgi:hypothetical protein